MKNIKVTRSAINRPTAPSKDMYDLKGHFLPSTIPQLAHANLIGVKLYSKTEAKRQGVELEPDAVACTYGYRWYPLYRAKRK